MSGAKESIRRWFRFTGVYPVGIFLVLHMWTSAAILTSRDAYDAELVAVNGLPIIGLLEVVLVFLPLAFHALFGIHLAFKPDAGPHHYASDGLHKAQRITGIVALVFIVAHFWELRLQGFVGDLRANTYSTRLEEHLSSTTWGIPFVAFGYLVGIAACVFHLANGMTSHWSRTGRAKEPSELRRARIGFGALGGLFFATSFLVVLQLATGTRLLPAPDPGIKGAPCPASPAGPAGSAAPGVSSAPKQP